MWKDFDNMALAFAGIIAGASIYWFVDRKLNEWYPPKECGCAK